MALKFGGIILATPNLTTTTSISPPLLLLQACCHADQRGS